MFEPRIFRELLNQKELTFLGGTPEFDLWVYGTEKRTNVLRIQNIRGTPNEWDLFDIQLLPNQPHGMKYKWGDGGLYGAFNDVQLTLEQANEIETYLRCFAPWVLPSRSEEEGLTNE